MSETLRNKTEETRIYFFDNIRVFIIFLVVFLHSGLVYESGGYAAFFWIVDDPAVNDLVGLLNLFIDIFAMAILFFVSGYLAPKSIKKNSTMGFVKSKAKRLLLPWLAALFTLIPLYKYLFLYSRGLPQEEWYTYFHFSNSLGGQDWILSMNWLWFLPVLFLFSLLYLVITKTKLTFNFSLPVTVLIIFITGLAYSLIMSFGGWEGWTKTFLIDFQNERLLIYFLFFLLGAKSSGLKLFRDKPGGKKLYIIVNALAWIPMSFYTLLVINFFLNPGKYIFSLNIDRVVLWVSFHLSLLSMTYLVVSTFHRYFNKKGKLLNILQKSSYGVYIIHTVFVGLFGLLLLNFELPSLLKFLLLTAAVYITSNVLVYIHQAYLKPAVNKRAAAGNKEIVLSKNDLEV